MLSFWNPYITSSYYTINSINTLLVVFTLSSLLIARSKHSKVKLTRQGGGSARLIHGFEFGQRLFAEVSTFLGLFQVHLGLSELGQIEGSNFFCLFNLLLEAPQLKIKMDEISLDVKLLIHIAQCGNCRIFETLRF